MRLRLRSLLVATTVLATSISCVADKHPTSPIVPRITAIISGMTSEDGSIVAEYHPEAAPATNAGPTITVELPGAMIQGGSSIIPVSSATPFNRVLIAMEGRVGYYELTLPGDTTLTQVVVSIDPDATPGAAQMRVAAGAPSPLGDYAGGAVQILDVGTGEMQISASWDAFSDVDLSVETPDGSVIYYGNKTAQGGELDLDSNAGCSLDRKNNENVVWRDTPASGTYVVRLNYWGNCSSTRTNWVVTVRQGMDVQTFRGTFTGAGTPSADGQIVTTFTR